YPRRRCVRLFDGLKEAYTIVAAVSEGAMKPLVSYIRIGAVGLVALAVTGAFADEGRPVTAADVSGKKFCSNTGHWVQFAADGHATTDLGHHPKWSVLEPGVIK